MMSRMDWRRFLVILFLSIHQSYAGRIKLDSDGGYVDMVIAIKDDVPENPALLDAIQREFRLASSHLHTATRRMTYFKEIRILIPPSWSLQDEYEDITWESYIDADILIRPNSGYLPPDMPFVVNYGQCGTPGQQMFLTPEFISDPENGQGYGRPQKTVVHEFGHLRWGLKDEYPVEHDTYRDARYHHFYENPDTKEIEATRCVGAITGTIVPRMNSAPCKNSSKDGLPDKDLCHFIESSATNYRGSFMYNQHLDPVTEFCDDGTDPGIRHNIHAPNRQNIQCNYQSCWEIMRKHSDFSGPSRTSPNRPPSFKLIKEVQHTSVMLVLDTSGSMAGLRIDYLCYAAGMTISDVLPLGTRLGIVSFSSSALVISNIVPITTDAERQRLSSLLPTSTGGSTSIGSGIRTAVQMLRAEPIRTKRNIIVVSDGEENASPYISDVKNEVTEANVTVSTIAIGATVDESFEDLASATNGQSFLNSEGLTSLYLSFFQSIRGSEQSGTSSGAPVILETSRHEVQSGSNFTESFHIDDALTGHLTVIISYSQNSAFDGYATLVDPRGTVYNTSDFFHDETVVKQLKFIINQGHVEVGMWELTIVNLGNDETFEVIVQPVVAAGMTPITASASWALDNVEPPQRQILYVTVSKDLTPVINARVIATINTGGNTKTVVYPLDNGAGADSNKDDGVYSIYFTKFTSTGRYSVQVLVEGKPDSQLVIGAFLGGGSSMPVDDITEYEPTEVLYQPTGLFQREVIGETFVCESQSCIDAITMDLYPPNETIDLKATHVHPDDNTITLTFTAPGDDLSEGSASEYEFRYSYDFSDIVYQYNETEIIPGDWFVMGNTSAPKEAGTEEKFVIRVNTTGNITYNIAVVAIDDEMNRSQRSNIASSSGSLLFYQPPSSSFSIAVIAGVLAAVLILFVVVLLIVFCVTCKTKKNRPFRTLA